MLPLQMAVRSSSNAKTSEAFGGARPAQLLLTIA